MLEQIWKKKHDFFREDLDAVELQVFYGLLHFFGQLPSVTKHPSLLSLSLKLASLDAVGWLFTEVSVLKISQILPSGRKMRGFAKASNTWRPAKHE